MPKKCKAGDSTELQKEFPDNEACLKHRVEQPCHRDWYRQSEADTVHVMTWFNEEYSVYK